MHLRPAPSGHSLLMGNFMGAVRQSPVGEHAGAICSQDPGLLSRPDLSTANSLQEQMSHPPSPWGHGCVTPRTPPPARHRHGSPAPQGGPLYRAGAKPSQERRRIAKT